jgi:transketolase C-terminal domain/subunit
MFKVKSEWLKSDELMRDVYCKTLMEAAEHNDQIVVLDADLVSSSGMKPFFKAFPDRAVQCGVAEANMIGIAAGLSLTGKIPLRTALEPLLRAEYAIRFTYRRLMQSSMSGSSGPTRA